MDSWCRPVISKNGNRVSGGAARLVRIARYSNGMDEIIYDAARDAAQNALNRANQLVRAGNMKRVK